MVGCKLGQRMTQQDIHWVNDDGKGPNVALASCVSEMPTLKGYPAALWFGRGIHLLSSRLRNKNT